MPVKDMLADGLRSFVRLFVDGVRVSAAHWPQLAVCSCSAGLGAWRSCGWPPWCRTGAGSVAVDEPGLLEVLGEVVHQQRLVV